MNSVICTLFENDYHKGLAALINSLYKNNFRGDIYAGYRGTLPEWTTNAVANQIKGWEDTKTISFKFGINLHFLPITTTYHLTNYKPDFLMKLWNIVDIDCKSIFYFDPDIVIKCKWSFFEEWVEFGVALVHEIVSNDMPSSHPIRKKWGVIIEANGMKITRELNSYLNGGFCGIPRESIEFVKLWSDYIDLAIKLYKPDPSRFMSVDRTYPFFSIDQDALNIAAMCSLSSISEIGPEGMDFLNSGWTMSHAVGALKPWKKNYLLSALRGNPPSLADKSYWKNTNSPIIVYSPIQLKLKRMEIRLSSFIGRFYRKY